MFVRIKNKTFLKNDKNLDIFCFLDICLPFWFCNLVHFIHVDTLYVFVFPFLYVTLDVQFWFSLAIIQVLAVKFVNCAMSVFYYPTTDFRDFENGSNQFKKSPRYKSCLNYIVFSLRLGYIF